MIIADTATLNTTDIDQMLKLIHGFSLSTEFFHWFAGDELENRIISERFREGIYERIGEYYIQNICVFDGGGKFYLDKIPASFNRNLISEKEIFYAALADLKKMEKRTISGKLDGYYYTVVSDMYYQGQPCGACWEIYHLANLIQIHKSKDLKSSELANV